MSFARLLNPPNHEGANGHSCTFNLSAPDGITVKDKFIT